MIVWIACNNNGLRFHYRLLVLYDVICNLTSMTGVSEELWITEWEFKGNPWTNPAMYDRWSPHKFVHRSEEHTSELQSRVDIVCRLLLEKKKLKVWAAMYA